VTQQVQLLRTETAGEVQRAGKAVAMVGTGGALLAAGGVFAGLMATHLLQRVTRLPIWLCYGAVGAGLTATGVTFVRAGITTIGDIQLIPPPETRAAVEENMEWVKKQITSP
jgi:tetrahydromethanopterin S-methyltransferase subunit D